jgi:hypothetical protein
VVTLLAIVGSIYMLAFAAGCAVQVVMAIRTGHIQTRHGVFQEKKPADWLLGLDREQLVLGLLLRGLCRLGLA